GQREEEQSEARSQLQYLPNGEEKAKIEKCCSRPPPPSASLASPGLQSELLEAKSRVEYFEIAARSVLNRSKPGMPFRWTINPYRGCEFGCKYCDARYTHEYMELDA